MGRNTPAGRWLWLIVIAWIGLATTAEAENPLQRAVPLGERGSLPLIRETVRVTVDHQHAKTTVQRIFRNRTSARMEGRFTYHAGEATSVTGFAYWNGEQKIVGEVFEKEVARRVYKETVSRKADPGLLETDGEGSFSFSVFPIEPAEEKRVELQLQQWLARRRGQIEYTLPIARADASIDIVIEDARGVRELRSPSHAITQSAAGTNRVRVVAKSQGKGARQLVLRWTPDDSPEAAGGRVFPLRAFVHRDAGHDAYVVLSLAAQPVVNRKLIVPKDVTLVIDRSGSMSGEPLERARAAAVAMIRRLSHRDRLNVIVFDDTADKLYNRPKRVSAQTQAEAVEFVERVIDGGGTDLAFALETAFASQYDDHRPKNVLFVTDGVSDSQAALKVAEQEKRDVRVFTLGLGEGVEKPLLSQLAKLKRGQFTFVESADVLESRVASVYRHIEAPVLVDLELQADGPTLTQVYPPRLPDLFQADELRVVARVRGSGPMTLTLTGRDTLGPVRMVTTVQVPKRARRPWVARLWANARIDHLGERMALVGDSLEMRDETIELALAYDVVTQYTSFLAIPESELTWQTAKTLAEARERKMAVRAKMADAAALQDGETMVAVGGGELEVAATSTSSDVDEAVSMNSAPEPEMSPVRGRRAKHSAGCASCRTSGAPGPLALVMPLLLLAVRRRRA